MRSITAKLLLSIGCITLFFLASISYFFYELTHRQINNVIGQQAAMALQFDLAIRSYVGEYIRPVISERIDEDEFIVEAMSTSYVARSIFETVRKDFPEYIIKFSADNPRNPINQAGQEELEIISYFNKNPNVDQWKGEISFNNKPYMAIFNARRMESACIHCHGEPQDAPASLIERYGPEAGFHKTLGKVIGMDTVAIPMGKITEKVWNELNHIFAIFVIGLLIFFFAIVLAIKWLVINRLVKISSHFSSAIEASNYSQISPIHVNGNDEIRELVVGYNTLTDKLKGFYTALDQKVQERTQRLEIMNKQLRRQINERKTTEKALRESEERFKTLHNASFGGIAIHRERTILDCNKGLTEMTGYPLTELIGMDILNLIASESHGIILEKMESCYEKPYEVTGRRQNNETYPLRIEARNIPYMGRPARTVEFRDLTEQKKAEQEKENLQNQLIQSHKMESVGRLAGGVAHDFNNMLSVIIGHTELALHDIDLADPTSRHLNEIRKAAKRSANLTTQLLAFARQQPIAPRRLHLNKTVEGMLKMLRRLIGEDFELLWSPAENLWPVKIDPTQVDQILVNLCVNARDAIENIGRISIETANVILDDDYGHDHLGCTPGEYAMIAVSDNGAGMDKITQNNLFEPFFTTKKRGEGTGLGLATVYGIVKQNKGYINVYSEKGKGSTFKIYLPKLKEKTVELQAPGASSPQPMRGNETILIVEDELDILDMAREMLEYMGYHVLAAHSPNKALEIAHTRCDQGIDLLITDVVMPEMNGRELSERLLQQFPNLKCLFMSGYTADVIAHHGVLDRGVQFINKPFSQHALATKMREILDGTK